MVRTYKSVRGLDAELYQRAKSEAALRSATDKKVNIGDIITEALDTYFNFEERAEEYCRQHGWGEPK